MSSTTEALRSLLVYAFLLAYTKPEFFHFVFSFLLFLFHFLSFFQKLMRVISKNTISTSFLPFFREDWRAGLKSSWSWVLRKTGIRIGTRGVWRQKSVAVSDFDDVIDKQEVVLIVLAPCFRACPHLCFSSPLVAGFLVLPFSAQIKYQISIFPGRQTRTWLISPGTLT